MTVNVSKPVVNVREKLAELDKPTGIAGEAMLRAETPQEQFQLINAGRKNLVINGDMRINQRQNTPFTGTSGYTIDRWNCAKNYGGWSISESTGHADEIGYNTAIKIDCTSTATMGTNNYAELQHKIEGSNLQHLQWGGSKGQPITLSFWVKSNLTGLYSVTVAPSGNLYNASYTIDSPNTWEKKYITIPPLTTASITDGNVSGMVLEFWIALGTAYTDSTTDWGSSPSYGRDGQVNFMSSTDNEWLLTGVQLELGKVATPFEHRSYGEELALCKRYFYRHNIVSNRPVMGALSYVENGTQTRGPIQFPVEMRSSPTLTVDSGTYNFVNGTTSIGVSLSLQSASPQVALIYGSGSGLTTGAVGYIRPTTDASISFDAEL